MPKTILSLRLDETTVDKLDSIARALDRSRSWVIGDAIRLYLETEGKDIEAILEGIAEADRGEFATEAKLEAIFGKYRKAAEAAE